MLLAMSPGMGWRAAEVARPNHTWSGRGQLLLCPPGHLCLRKQHGLRDGASGRGGYPGVPSGPAWVSGPYFMHSPVVCHVTPGTPPVMKSWPNFNAGSSVVAAGPLLHVALEMAAVVARNGSRPRRDAAYIGTSRSFTHLRQPHKFRFPGGWHNTCCTPLHGQKMPAMPFVHASGHRERTQ